MSLNIVVVGSLNMDLVAYTARLPEMGETILGQDFQTFPGGKGANQAVAAARLGAGVSMIGKVGQDAFGQALIENLQHNGVDTQSIFKDPDRPTGTAVITVDSEGRNTIVVISGSNYRLSPQDVESCRQTIAGAAVLLLQLETPLETVLRAAQLAHESGVKVLLNPAPAQDLPDELYSLVDILIPNETEAALLTGLPVENREQVVQAAGSLLAKGAKSVLITLGRQGAVWVNASGSRFIPAFEVKAVDSTAAGDAFIGGLGCALASRMSMEEALRWGSAAGALAVTRKGAQSSLPTAAELKAFLAGNS